MLDIGNLVKSVTTEISKDELNEFAKQVEERLKSMEKDEAKEFTLDRFEGDNAVLENRETKEIININKSDLPKDTKEGTILKYQNEEFSIDKKEQKKTEERIKQKIENLWNN